MTRTQLVAWAAGFFDGEGCVCIALRRFKRHSPSYAVRVSVSQKADYPLLVLQALWGGAISVNRTTDVYAWQLSDHTKMTRFLRDVRPYLLLKGSQADVALAYFALTRKHPPAKREQLRQRLKLLRPKGPRAEEA